MCSSISAGSADSEGGIFVNRASAEAEVSNQMLSLLLRRFLGSSRESMNAPGSIVRVLHVLAKLAESDN